MKRLARIISAFKNYNQGKLKPYIKGIKKVGRNANSLLTNPLNSATKLQK